MRRRWAFARTHFPEPVVFPFTLPGPSFLAFYAVLSAVVLFGFWLYARYGGETVGAAFTLTVIALEVVVAPALSVATAVSEYVPEGTLLQVTL